MIQNLQILRGRAPEYLFFKKSKIQQNRNKINKRKPSPDVITSTCRNLWPKGLLRTLKYLLFYLFMEDCESVCELTTKYQFRAKKLKLCFLCLVYVASPILNVSITTKFKLLYTVAISSPYVQFIGYEQQDLNGNNGLMKIMPTNPTAGKN